MPSLAEVPDNLPIEAIVAEAMAGAPLGQRLETLMQRRLGNRVRNLRVHVRPAGLILEGRAGTYYAKQLAQHAAMELADTPILANEIEVR
jgi:hypothetical protein